MIRSVGSAVVLSFLLFLSSAAFANSEGELLNFQGLGDLQPVGNFYNGGGMPFTPGVAPSRRTQRELPQFS